MTIPLSTTGAAYDLRQRVEAMSGQRLAACYQCGTCTAGCPFIEAMDVPPDRLIRRLLIGMPDVLECQTFWLCVGCDLCAARCPRAIDVPRVMEALRLIVLRERGDRLDPVQLREETRHDLPPIALVASLRRHLG